MKKRRDKFYKWMKEHNVCEYGLKLHADTYTLKDFLVKAIGKAEHRSANSRYWIRMNYWSIVGIVTDETKRKRLGRILHSARIYSHPGETARKIKAMDFTSSADSQVKQVS